MIAVVIRANAYKLPPRVPLVEGTAPARRGSIYTATQGLLLTGADADPIHAREAEACGVRVVDPDASGQELRRLVV